MFQSAPLMRGATFIGLHGSRKAGVSIRAPHARGDLLRCRSATGSASFNPRPSCEGRLAAWGSLATPCRFQSAPLMRGATGFDALHLAERDVSIRAPHARGDAVRCCANCQDIVSIRAPHARGDQPSPRGPARSPCFNPRPSCEGRRLRFAAGLGCGAFQSAPLMRGATGISLGGDHT